MPAYDFDCPSCGPFTRLMSIARRNDPVMCIGCGEPANRLVVAPTLLSSVASPGFAARAINERSANSPQTSEEYRSRHGSGCGCCTPGRASKTATNPDGSKFFRRARPWQISH